MNSTLNHAARYTYDGVNRLSTAVATGNVAYSQAYNYTGDGSNGQFGNMGCTASPSEPQCLAPSYSATTNRITTSGYTYDAAGDVTGDGTYTYTWDAEAHLTKVVQSGTTISTDTYNALGQRVRDVTTTVTTDEAYGADGSLLWRYTGSSSTNRSYVPFEGGILAEYFLGGTLFDHPDQLGSISTSSDHTGNNIAERLFYPYGELWTGADPNNFNMHRTFAKLPDYDSETDQYNTLNRHYTPSGRWMSPDPGGEKVVNLEDPQTWNMYAYVRNNPTTLTDPTGLCPSSDPSEICNAGVGSGRQKDAAQNTAYTATILGQKVPVSITGGTADDRAAIQGRLNGAIGDINQHAGDLSASDTKTIHNIKSRVPHSFAVFANEWAHCHNLTVRRVTVKVKLLWLL